MEVEVHIVFRVLTPCSLVSYWSNIYMRVTSIYRVCSQKCWYCPTRVHGVKNFLKDFKTDFRTFPCPIIP